MPSITITVMAVASSTTQLLNPELEHVILLDGVVVFRQKTKLAPNTEGVGITIPAAGQPPINVSTGTHTIGYYNTDTRPWRACIIIQWLKADGTYTSPRLITYGQASQASTVSATVEIGRANILLDGYSLSQQCWQPGDALGGTITIKNDGEADDGYRVKIKFLGTTAVYTSNWKLLAKGATDTIDLSTIHFTIPSWTEIDWTAYHPYDRGPWALIEVTIETLAANILSSIGYLSCNYTLEVRIAAWSVTSSGTVPLTINLVTNLTCIERDRNGAMINAYAIPNKPVEIYINDEPYPPPAGVTRLTDKNGRYIESIEFTLAGQYVIWSLFNGDTDYPPALVEAVHVLTVEPKVGAYMEIVPESITLPCNQKLAAGTTIAGKVSVKNTGDASGYPALRVYFFYDKIMEYATLWSSALLEPCTPTSCPTQNFDIGSLNFTMPNAPLEIWLQPGKVDATAADPAATFVATGDPTICTIYSLVGPLGHIVSYNLPSSLQAGQLVTGSVTLTNQGDMRGTIALRITTLWDNRQYTLTLELDPNVAWTVDVSQFNIIMPNQNATVRLEAGHVAEGTYAWDETTDVTILLAGGAPPGYARVFGTVTDAYTGKPVPNATVNINGYTTKTDLQGNYSLDVPTGTYTLTVTATGYETHSETRNFPEETVYQVNVALTPTTAVVTGIVRDAKTGGAISGVTVTLQNGGKFYSATTDASGRYLIDKVQPAITYTIRAEKTGYQPYEGTINVSTNQIYRYDIHLTPIPPPPAVATVSGRVISLLGAVGAKVTLNEYETTTNPDGTFTIENVPFGTYTLTVTPQNLIHKLLLRSYSEKMDIYNYTVTKTVSLPLNLLNVTILGGSSLAVLGVITYKATKPTYYY